MRFLHHTNETLKVPGGIISPSSPLNMQDVYQFEEALLQATDFASIDFRGKHK